jgi:hypothetical protein
LQTRKVKRLRREQHRLALLQHLMQEQAVLVGRLMLDQQQLLQERQMFLELPVEELEPVKPEPTPPPAVRGRPEPMEPQPDPMAELSQRLGLPAQQS